MNGGFGLVLDGSERADAKVKLMLKWDVLNGVSRRAWAKNDNAMETVELAMEHDPKLQVTIANKTDSKDLIRQAYKKQ